MHFQGNSASKVNPVYAKICEVVVPVSEEDKHGESFPKHKLVQKATFYTLNKNVNTLFNIFSLNIL